jgi:hypothetical protein
MTDALDADEWVPASLSALLGMQQDDPDGSSEISQRAATDHLASTRAISSRRAAFIVENGRCDECRCELGAPVNLDACECPCHCTCCCPPLFHCLPKCACDCNSHCEPNASDSEKSDAGEQDNNASSYGQANRRDEIVQETPATQRSATDGAAREPNAGERGAANSSEPDDKEMQEDSDEDDDARSSKQDSKMTSSGHENAAGDDQNQESHGSVSSDKRRIQTGMTR